MSGLNLLKLLSLCELNTKELSELINCTVFLLCLLRCRKIIVPWRDPVWRTFSFVLKVPITQKDHLWKDLCRRRAQRYWKEQKGVAFGAVICLDGRKSRKVGHWASRSVKHRWHHSYTTSARLLIKQPLGAADNSQQLVPARWCHWLIFICPCVTRVCLSSSPCLLAFVERAVFGVDSLFYGLYLWVSPTPRVYKGIESPFSENLCHKKNHMQSAKPGNTTEKLKVTRQSFCSRDSHFHSWACLHV